MNYDNTKSMGAAQAAEERRGPDRPQASHYQVKKIEALVWELVELARRMPHSGGLGAPDSGILYGEAMRAARSSAVSQIFDAFGFGTSTH